MIKVDPETQETLAHVARAEEHRLWLRQAHEAAQDSPHPSVKVGAVVVGPDGHEIAHACNRFAHGLDSDRAERYDDGVRSLWINCAEQMVLIDAARRKADLKGARLYVTLEPCAICAGLIVESGIAEVIIPVRSMRAYAKLKTKWKRSIEVGRAKLTEAGVRVTAVDAD